MRPWLPALLALLVTASAATADTIVTPSNLTETRWEPVNIVASGTAQIMADFPRGGAGSLKFTTSGPLDRAEYDTYSFQPTGLGLLSQLTSLSFDWYRSSASTTEPENSPLVRILVYDPDADQSFLLNWQGKHNGQAVPTNTWQTASIADQYFWQHTFRPIGQPSCDVDVYDVTLAEWLTGNNNGTPIASQSTCPPQLPGPNSYVSAIYFGVDYCNGTFIGAIDKVQFTFGGQSSSFNFEPEGATPTRTTSWGQIKSSYR